MFKKVDAVVAAIILLLTLAFHVFGCWAILLIAGAMIIGRIINVEVVKKHPSPTDEPVK